MRVTCEKNAAVYHILLARRISCKKLKTVLLKQQKNNDTFVHVIIIERDENGVLL